MYKPVQQVANYLYSTTTRFQVRTPSSSSSHICWIVSLRFCTSSPVSDEEAFEDVGLLAADANLSLCSSLACAARAPLLGRRLVCDKGCRISQADGEHEADETIFPFSIIDWSQKSCSFAWSNADVGMMFVCLRRRYLIYRWMKMRPRREKLTRVVTGKRNPAVNCRSSRDRQSYLCSAMFMTWLWMVG